jgi:hypothetical protein
MGLDTETNDWQVLGISAFGFALGLAAEVFVFDFYSATADITARFRFIGYGSGLGVRAGSWVLPGITEWSSLDCQRPFSASQLDHAAGTLASVTVGVGVNVGPCLISAIKSSGSLFTDQDAGGISGGLSAGAVALAGRWRFSQTVSNAPLASVGA